VSVGGCDGDEDQDQEQKQEQKQEQDQAEDEDEDGANFQAVMGWAGVGPVENAMKTNFVYIFLNFFSTGCGMPGCWDAGL